MTRREWGELGLILALALALRLALWWVLPREDLVSDEREYLAAATWLAHGRGFSFYADWPWLRPPVYLVFLAPLIRLFGFGLSPIRIAQVILSLLVPALVYLLARMALSRRVALAAGLLSALWLPLAILPHLVLAENLFLPLLLAAFYCLVRFQRDRRRGWALLGGGLLGLTTLTRGLALGFLPLAALWLLLIGWRQPPVGKRRVLSRWLPVMLLLAAALVVILPWTGYNYLRYGRLILIDTTGGYNFWLGTQGGQFDNLHEVHQALLEQPDPAARQAYAYQQGWAAIAADPGRFLTDRVTEVGQLLRINYGADERLVDGFALGQATVPHLLALFFLEDTLYVLLVPLALVGLFTRRGEAGRGLVLLWLGYNLLTAVAFFAIGRFRLPLLPFLAIYAAAVLERPWRQGQARSEGPAQGEGRPVRPRPSLARLIAAGLLTVAFWAVVLPSYVGPYPTSQGATVLGLQARGAAGHLAQSEAALRSGDLPAAWEALQPALEYRPDGVHPAATVQVALAEWLRANGEEQGALAALQNLDWHQADLLRGDILRADGDMGGARAAFATRTVRERNPAGWAWTHLHPPASREIDLGGDLDWGLVDGFYQGEHEDGITYRWSGAVASLRFPQAGTGQPLALHLQIRGWRPEGEEAAVVTLALGEAEVACFTAPGAWEEVATTLPAMPPGEDIVVTLHTTTFLAGPRDLLLTGKLRFLGVMVDEARVEE